MKRKALILLSTAILSSCAYQNSNVKTTIPQPTKKISQPKKTPTLTINVNPLPLKPKTLTEMENIKTENTHPVNVNLTFNDIPLNKALLMLAKATGYNVIIPPDINGTVTLELKEDSLESCLNALLKPFGYSYKIDGNNIYVITKLTKVFHLNLPQINRTLTSSIQATIGGESSNTGVNTSTSSATMSISNNYSSEFWNNVKSALETLLKEDKTASYSIEPLTGTIVVSAKPKTMKRIENFIKTLNKETEKQVLIEAKIVEVKLDKKNQTGINWKYLTFSNFLGSGGEYSTITFNSGSPSSMPFQLSVVKVNNTFSALLGLLSQFGKVNVLSSPRILAMNGQPAMIKVGRDYIVIYKTQTTSTTSTAGETASTLTTEEINTDTILTEGVVLTIVPHIDDKGNVILNITPAISSLDTPIVSGFTNTTEDLLNKIYAVNIRQLNTVIKARSGQTIILGGLIAKSKSETKEGVPFFQDLPLIGNAFKSNTQTSSKTELVIMLTPYVEK
ncbi:MSHA biogenesis protein MshL [Desulfurobacterium pacificum]|uniref:MSHA biogenesis protein MshL n=1 Tax=Desulfurobacterium pacificum TaxID=240166 RepID=A0ABY1NMD5_9BACT|nr:secretin and TonB N-terminal domain-containing protein [Desulfurobacterium pacificum]SMP12486.1 MSHA biogenesis protein MshL [Desulfurobacterium pacificum]